MIENKKKKIPNLVRIKHPIPIQIAQPDPILQRTILRLIPERNGIEIRKLQQTLENKAQHIKIHS